MSTVQPVALIDTDYRRRAQIANTLLASSRYIEPFESVAEFVDAGCRSSVLLVHDEGTLIEETVSALTSLGKVFVIAAYGLNPDTRRIVTAMRAGAFSWTAWPMSRVELVEAVDECDLHLRPRLARGRLADASARRIEKLSPREKQVLDRVAKGFANRDIASELGISARTVEVHRANMLRRLGAQNTPDALRIAYEARLSAA